MKIIAFEGIDGVGKTTQVDLTRQILESKGCKVHIEHFPRYDTPIGGLIKEILNGEKDMPVFSAMQMLYAADQTDFITVIDDLYKNKYDYLLLDRYMLSTIVYYCSKTQNLNGYKIVSEWQKFIVIPDTIIVFTTNKNINDKESFKELDLFEKDKSLMKNVNAYYEHFANLLKYQNCVCVNADDSITNINNKILSIILKGEK